jgi:sugar lactone lactonase YvrE
MVALRRLAAGSAVGVGLITAYLLLWPVPIEPHAWEAPPDPGYTGPFATNDRLSGMEVLPIGEHRGPEDVAIDVNGFIYAGTKSGDIVRLNPDGTQPTVFANTGGRPLGIDFDADGNLLIADGYRGLLSVSPQGAVTVLTAEVDGTPILYADDVDTAADGTIYFSDATTRFSAKEWGGTLEASLLDLMEHGKTGRLLAYDPRTRQTRVVASGFSFANGVAVSPDQTFVVVNETGEYRVWRVWIAGERAGQKDVLIDHLPAFPDNVSAGQDGRFWISLVSPRNPLLDGMSNRPVLRRIVQRLPAFLRPEAKAYGHVIAVDATGKVLADLQDPEGRHPLNTTALETDRFLYIGSLVAPGIGRLPRDRAGL